MIGQIILLFLINLPIRDNLRIRDNALCTNMTLIKRFHCIIIIASKICQIVSSEEESKVRGEVLPLENDFLTTLLDVVVV